MPPCPADVRCVGSKIGWARHYFSCNFTVARPGAATSSSRRGTKDNCSSQQSASRRLLVTRVRIYLQSWETMVLLARGWVTSLHPVPPPPRGRVPSTLPPQTRLELPQVPASVCAAPQHVLHVRGRAAQLRVVTTNLISRYHRYYRYYTGSFSKAFFSQGAVN